MTAAKFKALFKNLNVIHRRNKEGVEDMISTPSWIIVIISV
jgi:hypothetical protein